MKKEKNNVKMALAIKTVAFAMVVVVTIAMLFINTATVQAWFPGPKLSVSDVLYGAGPTYKMTINDSHYKFSVSFSHRFTFCDSSISASGNLLNHEVGVDEGSYSVYTQSDGSELIRITYKPLNVTVYYKAYMATDGSIHITRDTGSQFDDVSLGKICGVPCEVNPPAPKLPVFGPVYRP